MTSSLVGSEMCIRDRPTAHIPWRAHCGTIGRASGALPQHSAVGRRHAAAVSYTHLTLPTICSV
eukprot:5135349-Prorocentrum_lima.AAC.1